MSPRILAVSGIYPTQAQPESGAFVVAMLRALHEQGVDIEAVAPKSFASLLRGALRPGAAALAPEPWPVRRPSYLSVSPRLLPWRMTSSRRTYFSFRRAVNRALGQASGRFDFVYAHHFTSAWASLDWCKRASLGCVVVMGESALAGHYDRVLGDGVFAQTLSRLAGVIASSPENEALCRAACPHLQDRLIYLPNAVDADRFKPRNRAEARRRLGLPPGAKIAAFCGHFIERKGPLRVLEALDRHGGMQGVFLGQGAQQPTGPRVLHSGAVGHAELPWWLAAADTFVLPSLAEGMSNAILEAMSCGVPVIVSDRAFNRAFLDDSCAFLIDPTEPEAIAAALRKITDCPATAAQIAAVARERAGRFSLKAKAQALLAFAERVTSHQTVRNGASATGA